MLVEAPQRAVCATTNIKHIRKNSPGYKDGDTSNTHVVAIVDYTLNDQRLSSAKTKDYIYITALSWQWAAPLWCPCETTHVALLGDSYLYRITYIGFGGSILISFIYFVFIIYFSLFILFNYIVRACAILGKRQLFLLAHKVSC